MGFWSIVYSCSTAVVLACVSIIFSGIFIWVLDQSNFKGLVGVIFICLNTWVFITTRDLIVLFIAYELFLVPSFALVLFLGPNSRTVLSSLYFLLWTQLGSFLVFIGVLGLVFISNSPSFAGAGIWGVWSASIGVLGFGINVPVWPAHFWLTNTHVEAPTYFSIFLSGFLVNTAVYGLSIMLGYVTESVVRLLVLGFFIIGVIDASINMWSQTDLNRLVAYGTIQEMNLLSISVVFGAQHSWVVVLLFIITHTSLSTLFFYSVDVVFRRYGSRSVYTVRGLLGGSPQVGYCIFVSCLLFGGLPFTLNFLVEVMLGVHLIYVGFKLCACIFVIGNVLGLVGFVKGWFITLFGSSTVTPIGCGFSEVLVYGLAYGVLILGALLAWIL